MNPNTMTLPNAAEAISVASGLDDEEILSDLRFGTAFSVAGQSYWPNGDGTVTVTVDLSKPYRVIDDIDPADLDDDPSYR